MIRRSLRLSLPIIAILALGACKPESTSTAATPAAGESPAATPQPTMPLPAGNMLAELSGFDLASLPSKNPCALDSINGIHPAMATVKPGDQVAFGGWLTTSKLQAPTQLMLVLSGPVTVAMSGPTSVLRPDVAKSLKVDSPLNAGFHLESRLPQMPDGHYKVALVHSTASSLQACMTTGELVVASK